MSNKKVFFISLFVLILIVGYIIYNLFFSLNSVPQGELIRSIQSPNKRYVINTYIHHGDSLSADSVRGELVEFKTQKKKTIYWNYPDKDPYVKWLNNSEILIGNQTLNVLKGQTYDWRDDDNWVRKYPKQFIENNNPK